MSSRLPLEGSIDAQEHHNASFSVFAAQMYTLRHVASQDFAGACRRLAEMGYQGAELTDMRGQLPQPP